MLIWKFGELESAEMINTLAVNLLNENDIESLKEMAKENGIQEDMVQLFMEGEIPELCDVYTAAEGKIRAEMADPAIAKMMNENMLTYDWVQYILTQMDGNEKMARAIRSKGKSLIGCIGQLMAEAFKTRMPVPKEMLEAAGVTGCSCDFGIPGMGKAKKIIKEYYK